MKTARPIRLARPAMGTRFEIALWGDDAPRLRAAAEEALDEIQRLDRQLSAFDPASELSGLNRRAASEPVVLEPGFFALLREAVALSVATEGAFDPTLRPLMTAWGLLTGEGRVPSPEELATARARVGAELLILDEASGAVRYARPGVQVDLGGIAKGRAIDEAVGILRDAGVESALVHGGTSTAYGLGAPPKQDAWQIALRPPPGAEGELPVVRLRDESLSVSAGHGKSFTREGRVYGHVLDPRTGAPVENGPLLAAVKATSATVADALSTALLVLGEEGIERARAAGATQTVLIPPP